MSADHFFLIKYMETYADINFKFEETSSRALTMHNRPHLHGSYPQY